MSTPLAIQLQTPCPPGRKRSHSSLQVFDLTTPYNTKRSRICIQEVATVPAPGSISSSSSSSSVSSSNEAKLGPHIDEDDTPSGSESEDETSSSEDESSSDDALDAGCDSGSGGDSTTSSSSSSSSEDSDRDEVEAHLPRPATLGGQSMAGLQSVATPLGSVDTSLAAKLSSFLPQMAAANAELDGAREKGLLYEKNIEEVDEEGQYIEMNLGLGVLEEKWDDGFESESESCGSKESETDSNQSGSSTGLGRSDAMAVLMGKTATAKPKIQVVDDETL